MKSESQNFKSAGNGNTRRLIKTDNDPLSVLFELEDDVEQSTESFEKRSNKSSSDFRIRH
ncbi:hypothetical protein HAX54_030861, partial [Datura stramonium]|nr:hypothetical protein [Datura stramonium]